MIPDRTFLSQRFAKIRLGLYHVVGYSVAGEETVVQVPEMNVCFDIGRGPLFALTSDIVCLTHGHMDHIAGLAYYVSQRTFQGMKGGTILLHEDLLDPVRRMLEAWRDIERQSNPFTLIPMRPGTVHEVRKDFAIKAVATHHGSSCLGYVLLSVREKLRPEYLPLTGLQIATLRKQGVEIQYKLNVPLVAFLGDTTVGPVFDDPDVIAAETLITECTFFDAEHRRKAKHGKHTHIDDLVPVLEQMQAKYIILGHVSRRIGMRRAKSALRKRLSPELAERVMFLMDFEHAQDGGEIDLPEGADGGEG